MPCSCSLRALKLAGPHDRTRSQLASLQHQTLVLLGLCCCGGFQGSHNCLSYHVSVHITIDETTWSSFNYSPETTRWAYLIKHILELVLRQGTTLDVLHGAQLLGHPLAVLFPHRLHLLLGQLVLDTRIISQIDLCTDYEAGDTGTVVMDLWEPLLADVLERGRGGHAEADEENIGLGVGEGSESIVIFLTGGIKQAKGIWLVTNPRRNTQQVSACMMRVDNVVNWRMLVQASMNSGVVQNGLQWDWDSGSM